MNESESFTPSLIRQLKADEGVRLKPYKDTVGKLTIGYGRNLDDIGITLAEAEQMLYSDMRFALDGVYKFLPWATKLDDARLGVLANMAYNMGIHGLLGFHRFIAAMEEPLAFQVRFPVTFGVPTVNLYCVILPVFES